MVTTSKILTILITSTALLLTGCASLPSNGPTLGRVQKEAQADKTTIPYRIVDIDAATVKQPEAPDSIALLQLSALSADAVPVRSDMIQKGDTLTISVFEVGVALFTGNASPAADTSPRTPTASAQTMPAQVREDGSINLPYVGTVMAAGTYPETLAATIRNRLRRLSESPEVTVEIANSVSNVFYISGVVARPNRYRLTAAREHLLDAVALAGGTPLDRNDAAVTLVRGRRSITVPMNQIGAADLANVEIQPGDRLEITREKATYSVFGATDKVSQIPFETKNVTLAEAVARATGPADARANPRGVLVFRMTRGSNGEPPQATVYRIDMMKADSYFLAQMFQMRDKDVILFANSRSNMVQKLAGLFSNLFSPATTVVYATK